MLHTDPVTDEHSSYAPSHEEESSTALADHVIRVITGYRSVIGLTMIAVACAFILLATLYVLRTPAQRTTSLGFRLDFEGADAGNYPNGTRFSQTEIIDAALLRKAFDENQLSRYLPFSEFAHSVVVLESNAALERLAREYNAKLSEPRLTAVERERLESEFREKREGLNKNEYALILTRPSSVRYLPPTIVGKTLDDVLRNWADFAMKTRHVLQYDVPMLSEQGLRLEVDPNRDLITALLALRARMNELRRNIQALRGLPGAELIRTPDTNLSISELDLDLTYLQRVVLEPQIARAVTEGLTTDKQRTLSILEAQTAWDRRTLQTAETRVQVLRESLADYTRDSALRDGDVRKAAGVQGTTTPLPTGAPAEVVPQLSDTFIDRLVSMANDQADRKYRQKFVDDIRTAALEVGPLRASVAYSEGILQTTRSSGTASPQTIAVARAEYDQAVEALKRLTRSVNSIHNVLSRSLSTTGSLYTITAAPVTLVERGVSTASIVVAGVAVMVVSFILVIAAALLHSFVSDRARRGALSPAAGELT